MATETSDLGPNCLKDRSIYSSGQIEPDYEPVYNSRINWQRTFWGGASLKNLDSRSATEHKLAGERYGRVQGNVDIVGSRRNGSQLSIRVMMMTTIIMPMY